MSNALLSSKVVVEESEPNVRGIAGAPISVVGAVGLTERGPIGKAVRCTSLPDYQKRFGRILPGSDVSLAALGFFSNGGGELWVVRTAHYDDVGDPAMCKAAAASAWLTAVGTVPATAAAANVAPYALVDGDQLIVALSGGADQALSFHGSPAWVAAGNAGPYALVDGQTLDLRVDGVAAPQEITFAARAFQNIAAATPAEVVAAVNAQLRFGTSEIVAGALRLASTTRGTASRIEVTGGTAAPALRFARGVASGAGNVPSLAAVTVADVRAVLAPLSAQLVVVDAPALTLRAVAPTATLQLRGGTAAAFGFDTAAVHRSSEIAVPRAVRVDGADPGAYANRLRVRVQDSSSGSDLLVLEDGIVRERFPGVSLDRASPRHIERVVNDPRTGSTLIRVTDMTGEAAG